MLLIPFRTTAHHKISSQGFNETAVFYLAQYSIKQELQKSYDNFHILLIIKLRIQVPFYMDQGGKISVHVMFLQLRI